MFPFQVVSLLRRSRGELIGQRFLRDKRVQLFQCGELSSKVFGIQLCLRSDFVAVINGE